MDEENRLYVMSPSSSTLNSIVFYIKLEVVFSDLQHVWIIWYNITYLMTALYSYFMKGMIYDH